jgi:PBP1b-binding outer membrane lipoprotein LpoB
MDIQMRYLIIVLVGLFLIGCGNASEPNAKKEIVETKKPEKKVEVESPRTHIRVLAEDAGSKIPEHLLKLPIQTN